MLSTGIGEVAVLVSFTNEEVTEEFVKVRVVRLVVEAKSTGVASASGKKSNTPVFK